MRLRKHLLFSFLLLFLVACAPARDKGVPWSGFVECQTDADCLKIDPQAQCVQRQCEPCPSQGACPPCTKVCVWPPVEARGTKGEPAIEGPPAEPVFCAADVQECADGSFVARQPPSCGFASCPQGEAPTAGELIVPEEFQVAPGETETAESCAKKGGEWQRRFIGYFCNYPTTDAGKPCKTGAQCDGECIAELPDSEYGACSEFKVVFGCINFMDEGKVMPMCID